MYKILINNQLHITGDDLSIFDNFLINNATINNPEYLSAIKQGRKPKGEKQYYFYNRDNDTLFLTRGLLNEVENYLNSIGKKYKVIFDYNYDNLEKLDIKMTLDNFKLRPFQDELSKKMDEIDNGYAIVPTGGGKTIVMINEIVKKKIPTFILIHNKKLLYQFIDRLISFTNIKREDVGIYGDGKKELKPITIALMQSFGKFGEKKIQEITKDYGLFFIDEAHHLTAKTLLKIGKNVKSPYFYGLTATPDKKDGSALLFLQKIIGPLILKVEEEDLVKQGIILQPELYPIINYSSKIEDFHNDFFKFEDLNIIKKYINNISIEELITLYNSLGEKDRLLLIGENKNDIWNFYNEKLPGNMKTYTKILYTSIFKRNQSVLEKNKVVMAFDTPEQYRRVDLHKIKKALYYSKERSKLITNAIYYEFLHNKNKDPNILVISDQIAHLEFMYNELPDNLKKYATLLNGRQKDKEVKEIEERIAKKEIRIIFAIEKFVGEGWDVSHLDTFILTYPLKDHELLKQLVGRVIRSSPNKKYAKVYDIVDIENPITLSQFKKRFKNYYEKYTIFDREKINYILMKK